MVKKKTQRVTSCTQHEMELQQPPMEKGMSIQELVAKHMNEKVSMANPLKDHKRGCHPFLR